MYIFLFLFNTINGDFMKLSDIMCKSLIVCSVDDDISSISNKMLVNDVGLVLVCDRNRVVGIITDRDIACRVFSNELDPDITDYMTRDIISVDIDDSVYDVLDLMSKNRVKRIVVTNNNRVVGIISISDLLIIDEIKDEVFKTIKSIWKIGSNRHKYETEIDEFYL